MRTIHTAFAAILAFGVLAGCGRDTASETAATSAVETVTLADAEAPGPDAAVLGDPRAPIEIVEYLSTTCPHCAVFHMTLLPHIKTEWIDTGRARLAVRPLPTAPMQLAAAGFQMARCAGAERYFEMLDDLFATQEILFAAAQQGEALTYFEWVGEEYGLDPEGVEACLIDETGFAQLDAAGASAMAEGVGATPTFLINGVMFGSNELYDEAAWDAALESALAD